MPESDIQTAYQQQLAEKTRSTKTDLAPFFPGEIEVFASSPDHYRMRAEFKAWHDDSGVHYAMYHPGEYKKPYLLNQFPAGSKTIGELMPKLLSIINQNSTLRIKLFQIEFLTATTGEAIITLIYHRALNDDWQIAAESLGQTLGCHIIGRSRKQKRVIGKDFIIEVFTVRGRRYHYQQIESSFTQPNAQICEKMLEWACSKLGNTQGDLLELYCGNGNFTLPLSTLFRRVLATEISKASIASARFNCELNNIDNIEFVRMSSEELTDALNDVREFTRLKTVELKSYDFDSVLVDPPRAGLDPQTRQLISRFPRILYISCNPATLVRDIEILSTSHKVAEAALFDQFPFTAHRECGVLLSSTS